MPNPAERKTPAHTKGPWVYHYSPDAIDKYAIYREREDGSWTAHAWTRWHEADARLIAAAPEYHAAAIAMVNRHDQNARRANFEGCGCEDCTPFRAAIERATGGGEESKPIE